MCSRIRRIRRWTRFAGHGCNYCKTEKFPARSVNADNALPYVFLVDSFCATYNTQKLIKFDIAKPPRSIVTHCTIYDVLHPTHTQPNSVNVIFSMLHNGLRFLGQSACEQHSRVMNARQFRLPVDGRLQWTGTGTHGTHKCQRLSHIFGEIAQPRNCCIRDRLQFSHLEYRKKNINALI